MNRESQIKLVLAGLFTSIGLLLPILFHMLNISGIVFLPMHLPVLLCGLVCGYKLGGLSGIIVPLLTSVLTGKPVFYPAGVYMMFELAAYGFIAGLFKKRTNTAVALIAAMLGGRIVLGITQLTLLGFDIEVFAIKAFLTESFVTALPGILIQLVLIPVLMLVFKNAKLLTV